jgi:hypothetical protein
VIELKNLGLSENIFRYFRVSFHDLLSSNWAKAVTLQIMSVPDKKNVIVDVVIVTYIVWAEGVGKG